MISDTLFDALVEIDRYLSEDDFYGHGGIDGEYQAIVDVRNHMARVCAMLNTPPSAAVPVEPNLISAEEFAAAGKANSSDTPRHTRTHSQSPAARGMDDRLFP